jgi:hypothetical protein
MKKVALSISIIAVVLSAAWFYFAPGFEPLITFLLGIAGIIGSISIKAKVLGREFDAIKARWLAERELRRPNLDDARWILSEVLDFLQRLRVEPEADPFQSEIDRLTLAVKTVQNMQIYLGKV